MKKIESNLQIINKIKKKSDLETFLSELNKRTTTNFNHFGTITKQNAMVIARKELDRKDKIKFFSYLDDQLIAYSFLTKFEKFTKKHNCILGIVISSKWQKKGFGIKICRTMIKTAWLKNYKKIWLTVFSDNLTAIKLYKKLGFEVEGVFINDELIKSKNIDVLSMALFKTGIDNSKKRNKILDMVKEL